MKLIIKTEFFVTLDNAKYRQTCKYIYIFILHVIVSSYQLLANVLDIGGKYGQGRTPSARSSLSCMCVINGAPCCATVQVHWGWDEYQGWPHLELG